jgi:hypothetical protein
VVPLDAAVVALEAAVVGEPLAVDAEAPVVADPPALGLVDELPLPQAAITRVAPAAAAANAIARLGPTIRRLDARFACPMV